MLKTWYVSSKNSYLSSIEDSKNCYWEPVKHQKVVTVLTRTTVYPCMVISIVTYVIDISSILVWICLFLQTWYTHQYCFCNINKEKRCYRYTQCEFQTKTTFLMKSCAEIKLIFTEEYFPAAQSIWDELNLDLFWGELLQIPQR